jgi:uncharacterized protein (TIGR02117 family)
MSSADASRKPLAPRRRWRRLRRVAGAMLALVLGPPILYLTAALAGSAIAVHRDFVEARPGEGVEIFLVSNGIHVDFLVPARALDRDWSKVFPPEQFRGVDERWSHLLLGWGNRRFYLETPTWADLKVSTVLSAVFWPTPSVLHAQYVPQRPEPDASWRPIRLPAESYRKLCDFIESSFLKAPGGGAVLIEGKSYGPSDNFYEGVGSYHALRTCNLWTNRGLKAAEVRTALWSPFPQGILWQMP